MRDFDAEQTTLVSGPPLSGPVCRAVFLNSTPDAAFFTTKTRLDPADSVPGECSGSGADPTADMDVYRYDLATDSRKCVTCVVPGLDADVVSNITTNGTGRSTGVAVSEDGSRVYFESPHRLVPGAGSAEKGNAYRVNVETGDLEWVGAGVAVGTLAHTNQPTNALTSDGSVFVFRSDSPSLNPIGGGSDNGGTFQYYLYDDHDRSLTCVSCPQDGSLPRDEVKGSSDR